MTTWQILVVLLLGQIFAYLTPLEWWRDAIGMLCFIVVAITWGKNE